MISRYFWAGLCSPRSPNGSLHLSAWLMTVTRLSNNDGDNWLSHHHCQVWRSEGVVRWEISPQLGGESTLPVLQDCSTLSSLTRVLSSVVLPLPATNIFWAALLRKPSNLTSTRTHTSTSTTSHVSPQTVHFFILPFTGNVFLSPCLQNVNQMTCEGWLAVLWSSASRELWLSSPWQRYCTSSSWRGCRVWRCRVLISVSLYFVSWQNWSCFMPAGAHLSGSTEDIGWKWLSLTMKSIMVRQSCLTSLKPIIWIGKLQPWQKWY